MESRKWTCIINEDTWVPFKRNSVKKGHLKSNLLIKGFEIVARGCAEEDAIGHLIESSN